MEWTRYITYLHKTITLEEHETKHVVEELEEMDDKWHTHELKQKHAHKIGHKHCFISNLEGWNGYEVTCS